MLVGPPAAAHLGFVRSCLLRVLRAYVQIPNPFCCRRQPCSGMPGWGLPWLSLGERGREILQRACHLCLWPCRSSGDTAAAPAQRPPLPRPLLNPPLGFCIGVRVGAVRPDCMALGPASHCPEQGLARGKASRLGLSHQSTCAAQGSASQDSCQQPKPPWPHRGPASVSEMPLSSQKGHRSAPAVWGPLQVFGDPPFNGWVCARGSDGHRNPGARPGSSRSLAEGG